MMRYLSLCSGIEAATVAWRRPLGWKAVAFAEIEPFPAALLANHYPEVPNLGDFTKIKGKDYHGAVDLVVAGTPCQAFSVAGLRKGLADPRGNLTIELLRILAGARPRWVVWENVPGVLSIDGGRTFGTFLGGLAQLGYGFAYRVLDAQYFGVAQRRRRVFVVGYLGDWRPAAAVLFERASLRGDPSPRRREGQGVAAPLTAGVRKCDHAGSVAGGLIPETVGTLESRSHGGGFPGTDGACAGYVMACFGGNNTSGPIDVSPRLGCNERGSGYRCDFESDAFAVSVALRGRDGGGACEMGDDVACALRASQGGGDKQHVLAFPERLSGTACASSMDLSPALAARNPTAVAMPLQVRRLTPRECERLQGFPDDYTRIPWRGRTAEHCPDAPRYKSIGNSMAVPAIRWIGRRIDAVLPLLGEGEK